MLQFLGDNVIVIKLEGGGGGLAQSFSLVLFGWSVCQAE